MAMSFWIVLAFWPTFLSSCHLGVLCGNSFWIFFFPILISAFCSLVSLKRWMSFMNLVFSILLYRTFHCHLIMSNPSWLPCLSRASLGEMGLLLDSWTIYSICCCYSCPRQTGNVKGFYLPSYGEYYRGQMDAITKYLSLCLTCNIPVICMNMEFILLCVTDQFNNAGNICGFDATCWATFFQDTVWRRGLTNHIFIIYRKLLKTFSSWVKNMFCSCKLLLC